MIIEMFIFGEMIKQIRKKEKKKKLKTRTHSIDISLENIFIRTTYSPIILDALDLFGTKYYRVWLLQHFYDLNFKCKLHVYFAQSHHTIILFISIPNMSKIFLAQITQISCLHFNTDLFHLNLYLTFHSYVSDKNV